MLISDGLDLFLMSLNGSKSPETHKWYQRRLSPLLPFLGNVEIGSVTVHDLRRWRAALSERKVKYENHPSGRAPVEGGLSQHTLHGYVRAARRFFKWLEDEGILDANPARRLELPKLPKGVVKGIPQEDLEKILAAAANSCPRDFALTWFLYSTACRVGGVVRLRLSDLDLDHCRAYVHEKNDKTRPVFFVPQAIEAMRAWLAVRPDAYAKYSDDEHVFVGLRGPLQGSGVYQVMERLAGKAGVEHGWYPHNWRHRRLRQLQANGMSLKPLSQIAGHSGVEVTGDIYGTMSEDELQRIYMQYALPLSPKD